MEYRPIPGGGVITFMMHESCMISLYQTLDHFGSNTTFDITILHSKNLVQIQPIFCFPDPEMLTKESVRTDSVALNLPSADNNLSASCQETSFGRRTSYRSQISSRCFSCSYSEIEVYSGSESETDYDEVDGESHLSMCEWQ